MSRMKSQAEWAERIIAVVLVAWGLVACGPAIIEDSSVIANDAEIADTPDDVCIGDAVITMLAVDDSVQSVVLGPGGIVDALAQDTIHICMATISPDLAKRLHQAHAERRQVYISAPVLGRPEAAATGRMFVLAAGAKTPIKRCQPLFDAMAQRTFVAGDEPWMANLLKVCNNFLVTAAIESMARAMALAMGMA